jgi:hypothetical protein
LQFIATPRRLMAAVGAVLLLALLLLLLWPSSLPSARAYKAQADHWQLPSPATVDSDTALSVIQQRRLWAGTATPGSPVAGVAPVEEKPLTPPDWRIAGIYSEGHRLAVLVLTDDQPLPQTLRVGDQFPGGAKILAIGSERVTVSVQGLRLFLSTYPQ